VVHAYHCRVGHARRRDDAAERLPRLLCPCCRAGDRRGDALGFEHVALEELRTRGEVFRQLLAPFLVHVKHRRVAAGTADVLHACAAEARGAELLGWLPLELQVNSPARDKECPVVNLHDVWMVLMK
jgi:hypothetical protein